MLNSPAPGRSRLPTAQQQLDQAPQVRPQARQRIVDDPRLLPLLQRVAAGDRVALAAVYDLLAPQVLALVRLLLDAKGDGDAVERVVVETFCQVWRQAPPMAERHPNGAAWVLAVAVECAQRDRRSRPSCI